ncbi:hypothetical protein DA075_07895 [Methylobacterium currus]|uniref:Uncharacterized protein n=1 Tax=Methylobacterium currus TaxID=2051553 RepID=A0A2R4WH31_9HYPH|nr:hypothetical protein DA075_07895 [Methylobacterium currus]
MLGLLMILNSGMYDLGHLVDLIDAVKIWMSRRVDVWLGMCPVADTAVVPDIEFNPITLF